MSSPHPIRKRIEPLPHIPQSTIPMLNRSRAHLTAYVCVRSMGGIGLFSGDALVTAETANEFQASMDDVYRVVRDLEALGFTVERANERFIRASGSAELFGSKLGIIFEKRPPAGSSDNDTPWVPSLSSTAKLLDTPISQVEGLAFPDLLQLHAATRAPALNYHHLDAPHDIVAAMNAELDTRQDSSAHRSKRP